MSGSGSCCFWYFQKLSRLINDKEFLRLKSKNNYFIWHGNKKSLDIIDFYIKHAYEWGVAKW